MNLQINICINFICNSPKLEQPKCPSMGKWLNKLWYFRTMEYYPVIKWNRLVLHAATWINLKGIMLEKVNNHLKKLHSNQHNIVIFFWFKKTYQEDCFIWHSRNGRIIENRKQIIGQGIGAVGSGRVNDRTVSAFFVVVTTKSICREIAENSACMCIHKCI